MNRKTQVWIVGIAVLACAWLYGWNAAHSIKPSRPPEEGAVWKPWRFDALGIALLYQDIADPRNHYILSVNGDWIEQHRPADDVTFNGPRMIRVLSKPAEQPIEQALAEQFIATLEEEDARQGCEVAVYEEEKNNKQRFSIRPNASYAAVITQRTPPDDKPEPGCGAYGEYEGALYFEYHPQESATKFIFVDAGQDLPLFDQESIRFY